MSRSPVFLLTAAIIVLSGCGDPSSPTGTLPQVTGLQVVDSLSSGTEVYVSWNSVPDVDGYRLYWSRYTYSWDELVNLVDTFYVDDVALRDGAAGYYTVLAFKGVDTSSDYADYTNSLPVWTGSDTIWSDHAAPESLDAVIFTDSLVLVGKASDSMFVQDAYCYDGGWPQSPVGLYSGDLPPFGDGSPTLMAKGNNPAIAPDSGYTGEIHLIEEDMLFLETAGGNFVKLYVYEILADTVAADSIVYGIHFNTYFQPIPGLRVFSELM